MTIVDRLERHAHERPDTPAFGSPDRTVSYREFHALVGGCAAWLRSVPIEPGEQVGLSIADDLTHFVVALGLGALGSAHVTLPTYAPAAIRSRLAARTGVRRVVATDAAHRLPGTDVVALDPGRMASWSRHAPAPLDRPHPDAVFTFFTTSGSTGEAKIVPILHGRYMQQAPRGPGGSGLALSPLEHHFVKRVFLYAMLGGWTAVARGTSDLPLARLAATFDVDYVMGMTAQVGDIIADAERSGRLPPKAQVLLSGARCGASMRRDLLERACDAVAVTYSMQECGSIARVVERDANAVTDSVGRPHPGVELEVVDADGVPLPAGETGEIRVRVPGMASGYLDDEVATVAKFRDGWFQPGDLVTMSRDGTMVVHGRADDVMNLSGIKIAPAEIERALERHPAVKRVVAFPLDSPVHGQVPVAAVELVAGVSIGERELQRFAREQLGLAAPRRVTIVAAMPSTPQGKVDLKALAERFGAAER